MQKKRQKCLACGKPASGTMSRGCHQHCRRLQRQAIALGLESDGNLVRRGTLAPKKKPGRKKSNPVALQYNLSGP